jgi:hypothetical protein
MFLIGQLSSQIRKSPKASYPTLHTPERPLVLLIVFIVITLLKNTLRNTSCEALHTTSAPLRPFSSLLLLSRTKNSHIYYEFK